MGEGFAPTLEDGQTPGMPDIASAPEGAPAIVGAGIWALVVEDDTETRGAMAGVLEEAGYLVAEAADGLVALEVLRASPYPLIVLLDYWMPRADGAGVLRAVDAEPTLRRHIYVVVTATPELLPPAMAELLGRLNVPVIPKPFDTEELLEATAHAAARLRKRLPSD